MIIFDERTYQYTFGRRIMWNKRASTKTFKYLLTKIRFEKEQQRTIYFHSL